MYCSNQVNDISNNVKINPMKNLCQCRHFLK